MKKRNNYIALILLTFVSIFSFAQNKEIKGYQIIGDEIVFSFDKRDYELLVKDSYVKFDFSDFDIENVVVSGEFNNWTRDRWRMKKINDNVYELRKKIIDFSDKYTWEFKYIINSTYWAEPSRDYVNVVQAKEHGHNIGVYNLNMFTAYSDKNGNALFKLNGYKNAKKVILSGTFNRWNEELFKMDKSKNGWELKLKLKPGEYEYKFIIDGNWIEDKENPDQKMNEFGGYNSVINIQVPVTFKLNGYLNADRVVLSGSFVEWSENKFSMQKTSTGWETTIFLTGGKHHYKFIVDNEWIVDPSNIVKEYDSNGNINSVRMVK